MQWDTVRVFPAAEVDKFVQKVLAETAADVEEVIIEKAAKQISAF